MCIQSTGVRECLHTQWTNEYNKSVCKKEEYCFI